MPQVSQSQSDVTMSERRGCGPPAPGAVPQKDHPLILVCGGEGQTPGLQPRQKHPSRRHRQRGIEVIAIGRWEDFPEFSMGPTAISRVLTRGRKGRKTHRIVEEWPGRCCTAGFEEGGGATNQAPQHP